MVKLLRAVMFFATIARPLTIKKISGINYTIIETGNQAK